MYLSDEIRIAKMFMGPPIILILIPILVLGMYMDVQVGETLHSKR